MLNDKVDTSKIKLGEESCFKDDDSKKIVPIYYDENKQLTFTLKNKFFEISKVREDNFGRKYLIIRSKEITDILNSIVSSIDKYSVAKYDNYINLFFNKNSDFDFESVGENPFTACISINVASLYVHGNSAHLNLKIDDLIVIEIKKKLEIDYSKLQAAE